MDWIYIKRMQISILATHLAHVPEVCQIVDRFLSFARHVQNLPVRSVNPAGRHGRVCDTHTAVAACAAWAMSGPTPHFSFFDRKSVIA